jgi:hypothetical protein
MVQPYNYMVQAPSAFESLVSGLKIGTSLQEMEAQRQQRMLQQQAMQQKMQDDRRRQEMLQGLRQKPFAQWGSDDLLTAVETLPKEGLTFLQQQMAAMSADERRSRAMEMGTLASIALSGNKDMLASQFDERIELAPTPQAKQSLMAQKQAALLNPEAFAKYATGILPALGDEGKNVAENLLKVHGGLKATEPLSPEAKRKAVADAIQAEADAKIKLANAQTQAESNQAELELKRAQAAKARAESEGRGTPLVNVMPQYGAPPAGMQNIFDEQGRLVAQRPIPESEKDVVFQRQRAAIETLRSVGYDPETGEDDISKAIAASTSGGAQADIAAVMRYFGGTSKGMQAINKLQAAASRITTEILGGRLGAGISNTDREFILQGLGDIGNPRLTASERLAGWTSAKNRMVQIGILPAGSPVQPQQPAAPESGAKPVTEMSNEEILRRLGGQ